MNKYLKYLNDNYFRETGFIKIESKINSNRMKKINAFENSIFHHFRQLEKKLSKAKKLLKKNGFIVYKNNRKNEKSKR